MEEELVKVLKDLLLLMEQHGLENLRLMIAETRPANKKRGPGPYEIGCRLLEKYREEQVRRSQAEAKAVIEKVKN